MPEFPEEVADIARDLISGDYILANKRKASMERIQKFAVGAPDGSTASSAWQAILGGRGGTQTRTTTGAVSDATGFLAITLSTLPITATVSALTSGSRSLLVYVTGTDAAPEVGDPVVATISLTDGTIFGEAENLTFDEDGLYWFHGFGGDPTSTWFSGTRLDDIQSADGFQQWLALFTQGKGFSGGLLNATGPMPDGKVIVVDLTSANITATLPDPSAGYSPWPRELIIIQGAYSLTLNPGASSRINGGALDADYVVPTTASGIRRVWLTQSGTPGGDDTWYVTSEAKLDEVTATTDALDTRLDAIEAYAITTATVPGASATLGSEYLTRVTYAAALCALSGPASTTTWPVGVTKRVTKENTGAFGITFAPDSGGTVNGGAVNASMTLPGSDAPSSTTTADRSWLITRTATSTWRVATFGLADATTSRSGLMSAADKTLIDAITSTSVTSPRFLGSANNTAAAPTLLIEPAGNSGLYWDATTGVSLSVDAVARILARVSGTTEVSSGQGGTVSIFRMTNSSLSVDVYVASALATPEAVITAAVGALCVSVNSSVSKFWQKRTGTGNTGWVLIDRCESGTYTPTGTIVANLDSVTPNVSHYVRVGDEVTVFGSTAVDPTASGSITFGISLPIASNFAASTNASGFGSFQGMSCSADTTNDRMNAVYSANTLTTSYTIYFSFTYTVI